MRNAECGIKIGFCAVLSLVCVGVCLADGPVEIPATVRAAEHFYGAVGSGIDVSMVVAPTTVVAGDGATLTVTVTNVTNPAGVTRPPLDSMPVWARTFQIENGPTKRGEKTIAFDYVLRPRGPGETVLPRLRFASFNPAAAPGRQVQTTYADSVALTVTERLAEPVARPERFRTPVPPPGIALPSPFASWLSVTGLALVGVALAWRIGGRHPADAAAVGRRRALAAARARLGEARSSPDPAAVVGEVVRTYAGPLAFPAAAAAALTAACDAVRFGPGGVNPLSLVDRAELLIGGGS